MKRPSGAPREGLPGLWSLERLLTWLHLRGNVFGVAWVEPLTAGSGYPGSRGSRSTEAQLVMRRKKENLSKFVSQQRAELESER